MQREVLFVHTLLAAIWHSGNHNGYVNEFALLLPLPARVPRAPFKVITQIEAPPGECS